MSRRAMTLTILNCSLVLGMVCTAALTVNGQQAKGPEGGAKEGKGKGKGAAARPPLFFREDWKQTPQGGEHALMPESVGNPDLTLQFVGPTAKELLLTGNAGDENNPIHV